MAIPFKSELRDSLQQPRPPKIEGDPPRAPILTTEQILKVEQTTANPPQAIAGQEAHFRIVELERDADQNITKCIILMQEGEKQRALLVKGVLGKGTVGGERVQSVQVLDAVDLTTGQEFAIKEVTLARLGKSERAPGQTATSLSPVVEHEQQALKKAEMYKGAGVGLDVVMLTPGQASQIPDGQILDAQAREAGDNFSTLSIMQKAQGPNIEDLLYEKREVGGVKSAERKPMDRITALDIAIGVCQKVDRLHQNGLIHRDLKPNNIHRSPTGEIQIIDMGEAHLTEGRVDDIKIKETGEIKGTRQYVAPEIESKSGESEYSAKTDSFAVGMIFVELFTGYNVLQRQLELEREGKYKTVALQGKAIQEEMLKGLQDKLKEPNLSAEEKELFKHLQKMTSRKSSDRTDLNEDIVVFCDLAIKHLEKNPSPTTDAAINNFKKTKVDAELRQFQNENGNLLKENRELSAAVVSVVTYMNLRDSDPNKLKAAIGRLEQEAEKLGLFNKSAKAELRSIIQELKGLSPPTPQLVAAVPATKASTTPVGVDEAALHSVAPVIRFAGNSLPERERERAVVDSPRGPSIAITQPPAEQTADKAAPGTPRVARSRSSSMLVGFGNETLKSKSLKSGAGELASPSLPPDKKRSSSTGPSSH